jgi:hypothetical protein
MPGSVVLPKRQKLMWPYGGLLEKTVWRGSLMTLNVFSDEKPPLCGSWLLRMPHACRTHSVKDRVFRFDREDYGRRWVLYCLPIEVGAYSYL